jgi:hypothetical protein
MLSVDMTQTLSDSQKSLSSESHHPILCSYINVTSKIQVIRIINSPHLQLERIVFPQEHLMFEAVPEAKLEISTCETVTLVVPCQQLRVTTVCS